MGEKGQSHEAHRYGALQEVAGRTESFELSRRREESRRWELWRGPMQRAGGERAKGRGEAFQIKTGTAAAAAWRWPA